MKINIKFLDKIEWSMYATLNTIIPFVFLLLTRQNINLKNIVFSSIINMMEGDLLPKILFTGFINFMTMENNINWVIQSIIYIISVIIVHHIPYNNKLHQITYKNNFVKYILFIAIVFWMSFIFKEILNNTQKL